MFVQYDGLTTECFIDSMDTNLLYFVPKDSVDQKTVNLKEVYYAYNDFDRVFYYSWSFNENLNRKYIDHLQKLTIYFFLIFYCF